ncbi:DMT family transporter [Paraburkholderia youngii]|uniref:DMT family transporter n=1 Tax=Paraburkholderia youngii TaxID=2782701 RepID=UPI003D20707F
MPVASVWLMSFTLKVLPLGTASAVWAGIGAADPPVVNAARNFPSGDYSSDSDTRRRNPRQPLASKLTSYLVDVRRPIQRERFLPVAFHIRAIARQRHQIRIGPLQLRQQHGSRASHAVQFHGGQIEV